MSPVRQQSESRGQAVACLRFTLIELLIVFVILTVLASLLLPALTAARQRAGDVRCMNNVKQTLLACAMYEGDYSCYVTNWFPSCPYWGQNWDQGAYAYRHGNQPGGSHPTSGNSTVVPEYSGATLGHNDAELRGSSYSSWRGYLVAGGYASFEVLGCGVRGSKFVSAGGLSSVYSFVETSSSESFRRTIPFIWFGPGTADYEELTLRTSSSNLYLNGNDKRQVPWNHDGKRYFGRGPVIACRAEPVIRDREVSVWTHRGVTIGWGAADYPSIDSYIQPEITPFIQNIGMSDGSALFQHKVGWRYDTLE